MTRIGIRTIILSAIAFAALGGCARKDDVLNDTRDLTGDMRDAGRRVLDETQDLVNDVRN